MTAVNAAPGRPVLTRQRVQALIASVVAAATADGVEVAVVVTDTGGRLAGASRGNGVHYTATEVAMKKATAAAVFGRPTRELAELAEDVLVARATAALSDILLVPGGFPVHDEGQVVGGVGIAAGHYALDQAIGEKALAA